MNEEEREQFLRNVAFEVAEAFEGKTDTLTDLRVGEPSSRAFVACYEAKLGTPQSVAAELVQRIRDVAPDRLRFFAPGTDGPGVEQKLWGWNSVAVRLTAEWVSVKGVMLFTFDAYVQAA